MASTAFDIFISYARADSELVRPLVERLERDGFKVWWDAKQMAGGRPNLGQLADGIANSSHMVACLSDTYIKRDWTEFELNTNQSMDPANKRNRTIPVIMRPLTEDIPKQIIAFNIRNLTDPAEYEAEYSTVIKDIHRKPPIEPIAIDERALRKKCEAPFNVRDSDVALFRTRMAVGAIAKFLHIKMLGEPPATSSLDWLIEQLRSSGKLPEHIKIALGIAQTYGNFVVQDKMDDYTITQESIQPGLAALRVLSDWTFSKYCDHQPVHDFWDSICSRLPHSDPNVRSIPGTHYTLRLPRLSLNSLGPLYPGYDNKSNQSVAVNLVSLPDERADAFFEEVSQFLSLGDASIVRPLDAGKVVVDGELLCLYVVLEHVDGASLQDIVDQRGALAMLSAAEACRAIAKGLMGLHSHDPPMVHGDIKPANVIVDRYATIKVLCIGRNTSVASTNGSSQAAGGKMDSFLFSSPEQLSGAQKLTPKTDLFALRATLFYLLTGEYEARIRGSALTVKVPDAATEILLRLASCETAEEAYAALDAACRETVEGGPGLHEVVGRLLAPPETPTHTPPHEDEIPPPPPQPPPTELHQVAEYIVESRNAWPLGGKRILVWETGAETLRVLDGPQLVWRDSRPLSLRLVSHGPGYRLGVASWEGQVRCFDNGNGKPVISTELDGCVGDLKFCGDRWVAGTWKHSLVRIDKEGGVETLLTVKNGVFQIAGTEGGAWFAVADLAGAIALYSRAQKRVDVLPAEAVCSVAFAGRRLLVLSEQSLVTVELDGRKGAPERAPGAGGRLLQFDSEHCLLLGRNGDSWLIDDSGTMMPYCSVPAGHTVLSSSWCSKRFVLAMPEGGCVYWRDGSRKEAWSEAIAGTLSPDGRYLAVTLPGRVQLYEDPA